LTPDANSTKLIDIPVNSVPWDVFDVHRSDGKAVFNRIFAALFHSDHLAVFNMSDMQQTGVVFTGSAPTMLESSHSGEMLFVLRTCFSAMVSVDPENLHIIKAFNLPVPSPRDMAITKDDLYLLVSSDNGNLYFIPSAQFFNKKAKPVETHFRVLFDLDKAVIKPEFYKLLDQLAGRLKKTGEKVELDGYTCDLGTELHNKKLSLKRSESVREYLRDKGVPQKNITIKGFGDASPYAPNKDEKHRRLNRRVEIEIKK
jgi:OOP family OmpA-OmpF porin